MKSLHFPERIRCFSIAVTLLLIAALSQKAAGQQREPVPGESQQATAMASVRELFKDDFERIRRARSPTAISEFAAVLLQKGQETNDDPAARYVLLREAADLAADAARPELALTAVDVLARQFEIDTFVEKQAILNRAAKAARDADANHVLSSITLNLMEDAVAAERFDLAADLCLIASRAAGKARDRLLVREIADRRKNILRFEKERETANRAAKVLADTPDDPEANLVRGRYLCLIASRWDDGLPLLLKGDDKSLKSLAEKELSVPSTSAEQLELGNAWWKAADELIRTYQPGSRDRALEWYQLAAPNMSTIEKSIVEKQLREHYQTEKPQWTFAGIGNYAHEIDSLNHPQCPNELTAGFQNGVWRVTGQGKHDTRSLDGTTCGWFGKMVFWRVRRPATIRAQLRLDFVRTGMISKVAILDDNGDVLEALSIPQPAAKQTFVVTVAYEHLSSKVQIDVHEGDRVIANSEVTVDRGKAVHLGFASMVREPGDRCDVFCRFVETE